MLAVETLFHVICPSGISHGIYRGKSGWFISSFKSDTISFFERESQRLTLLAGIPYSSTSADGQFLFSSFSDPTRISYDSISNILFVAERTTGYIRMLDMASETVKTVCRYYNDELQKLVFGNGLQESGVFPGIDVQFYGDFLYITDSLKVYSVTSSRGLAGLDTEAVVTEYTSLTEYFSNYGFPIQSTFRVYVYGVAPDPDRRRLYVSVSNAKNVLLAIPMDASQPSSAIKVLAGDPSITFYNHFDYSNTPVSKNGYTSELDPTGALLAFPIHLRYYQALNTLYFTEAFPSTNDASFLFGSLTIRRLNLLTGFVDTFAGVDFSHNSSHYAYIGTQGGYQDGPIEEAKFSYPISFDVSGSVGLFAEIVLADLNNDAVRRTVFVVPSPAPTVSPAPSVNHSGTLPTNPPAMHTKVNASSPTSLSNRKFMSFLHSSYLSLMLIVFLCLVVSAGVSWLIVTGWKAVYRDTDRRQEILGINAGDGEGGGVMAWDEEDWDKEQYGASSGIADEDGGLKLLKSRDLSAFDSSTSNKALGGRNQSIDSFAVDVRVDMVSGSGSDKNDGSLRGNHNESKCYTPPQLLFSEPLIGGRDYKGSGHDAYEDSKTRSAALSGSSHSLVSVALADNLCSEQQAGRDGVGSARHAIGAYGRYIASAVWKRILPFRAKVEATSPETGEQRRLTEESTMETPDGIHGVRRALEKPFAETVTMVKEGKRTKLSPWQALSEEILTDSEDDVPAPVVDNTNEKLDLLPPPFLNKNDRSTSTSRQRDSKRFSI